MKLSNQGDVPVYTIAGASTARPLPEWLARKRKRSLKQDPEFANRVELLQDFEFEEASACVRVSEDGDWVMSTGTYKPQIHTHYLPHLSLSYARHTNTINETFILLSTDYSKSLHLQTDRMLEFHTPGGLHYSARIPRYGRDLKYNKRSAEALIPAVGVNADGNGEVYRLNLEIGRFMKGYEVDVGGDDMDTVGGGALQGGINTGAVNTAAIAEQSHNLMAFGTSIGTVEFWDNRSRSKVGILQAPRTVSTYGSDAKSQITALEFHRSGLNLATGSSTGLVSIYDLRSPVPLLQKGQGYDFPIKNLKYLDGSLSSEKIMSADKRVIKIWDAQSGDAWTSMEPAVDMNHVEWCPQSGMFLTANEGRQQHAFFIPQLGPAPKWCSFLDNLVEEMAEDAEDPSSYKANGFGAAGAVYDNYKFLSSEQLRELNMDHLVGQTNLLRPYMHGYFVAQQLYEQARLISNPDLFDQQREKSIAERIAKERESRIRGPKGAKVKVNRRLAEKIAAREEANERRKARRVLKQGGDEAKPAEEEDEDVAEAEVDADGAEATTKDRGVLSDPRFSKLFQDEDYEIDEMSREFAMHNPSTVPVATVNGKKPGGLTAAEEEALASGRGSSDDDSDDESEDEETRAARARQRQRRGDNDDEAPNANRISSTSYRKSGKKPQNRGGPKMVVSSSTAKPRDQRRNQSFGERAAGLSESQRRNGVARSTGGVGEKEISFTPARPDKRRPRDQDAVQGGSEQSGRQSKRFNDRRSASGNVFRRM